MRITPLSKRLDKIKASELHRAFKTLNPALQSFLTKSLNEGFDKLGPDDLRARLDGEEEAVSDGDLVIEFNQEECVCVYRRTLCQVPLRIAVSSLYKIPTWRWVLISQVAVE